MILEKIVQNGEFHSVAMSPGFLMSPHVFMSPYFWCHEWVHIFPDWTSSRFWDCCQVSEVRDNSGNLWLGSGGGLGFNPKCPLPKIFCLWVKITFLQFWNKKLSCWSSHLFVHRQFFALPKCLCPSIFMPLAQTKGQMTFWKMWLLWQFSFLHSLWHWKFAQWCKVVKLRGQHPHFALSANFLDFHAHLKPSNKWCAWMRSESRPKFHPHQNLDNFSDGMWDNRSDFPFRK